MTLFHTEVDVYRYMQMTFTNMTQLLFDILTFLVSYVITYFVLGCFWDLALFHEYDWAFVIFAIPMLLMMMAKDLYNETNFTYLDRLVRNLVQTAFMAALLSAYLLKSLQPIEHKGKFLGAYIIVCVVMLCMQWIVLSRHTFRQRGGKSLRILFVGESHLIGDYLRYLGKTSIKHEVAGVIFVGSGESCEVNGFKNIHCIGGLDELEGFLTDAVVDEVVFTVPHTHVGRMEHYMQICESRGITVKVALDFSNMSISHSSITAVGPMPVITYHTVCLNGTQNTLKRMLDILGAVAGLLLTGILSVVLVPVILLDSPGPVIFKQKRMGKNGRIFDMYKFRSMVPNAEQLKADLLQQNKIKDGMMFKVEKDPRITRVGAFIRKTSIDELPQFINVLKGEMSLVGTRPPTLDEVAKYQHEHYRRLSIKPGITGLWQISGRSDIEDFEDVVRLDTQYIDTWSVWTDVSIIVRTVLMILKRKQHSY